ncbi:hypothetical protein AB0N99_32730 [Streptomyces sp. NPDC093272]|uniref:hypothetical protein n=1 Tax=Streptomyces sp. NPDC093272 TaxID=3154981 RepID=UPI00343A7864
MARTLSAPAVIRKAIEVGAVPAVAEVARKGGASWSAGDFTYKAWIWKDHSGGLTWDLYVGDAKFGPQMEEYGGLAVTIRGANSSIPWPSSTDASLATFLQDGLGRAARFVTDRRDLATLLASREGVHRGDFFAWLPLANYPARLVEALILSRDIGDPDLESQILSELQGGPISLSNGRSLEILDTARSWAKDYSTALGFDVPIY